MGQVSIRIDTVFLPSLAILLIAEIARQADRFYESADLRACLDKYPYVYVR
jgi:hypothetical protein